MSARPLLHSPLGYLSAWLRWILIIINLGMVGFTIMAPTLAGGGIFEGWRWAEWANFRSNVTAGGMAQVLKRDQSWANPLLGQQGACNARQDPFFCQLKNIIENRVLTTVRLILYAVMVAYLVYAGISMVTAMGDEKKLRESKQSILYVMIAFLFINIPTQIYNIFQNTQKTAGGASRQNEDITRRIDGEGFLQRDDQANVLFNNESWSRFFGLESAEGGPGAIYSFAKIMLYGGAVAWVMFSGIRLILSRGSEEGRKKARNQVIYGVGSLLMVSFVDIWLNFVLAPQTANIQDTNIFVRAQDNVFSSLFNLLMLAAWPMAFIFLVMGAYFYITSAGNEDRAKRGKNIIINTVLGVFILLAIYTFMNDLLTFTPSAITTAPGPAPTPE
jgi:hypothetical protein